MAYRSVGGLSDGTPRLRRRRRWGEDRVPRSTRRSIARDRPMITIITYLDVATSNRVVEISEASSSIGIEARYYFLLPCPPFRFVVPALCFTRLVPR